MESILEKKISFKNAEEQGLTHEEYKNICDFLGRTPTFTELGIYSALWSEHCSYKNSILLLKTLPTRSKKNLTQAGEENAGALDIGDGLAVVFKIESHNHPTAIEPYQGAATGVGGIMRDIFTMGARPLCSLNSLRFGLPSEAHSRHLLTQAVKGIGDYGNSLGIPVMGGEVFFDNSFSRNCLVNAMVVGIAKHEDLSFAQSKGIGNPVFIVGASTGRDGVQGASFASQDLSEESEEKRSAVQVGDPFMEKLLMEATLEVLKGDAVIAIQDMGAAGLSCSSAEMSARGKLGMELNLDFVPLREKGMNAYEIMLSESQERMLVVVTKGREQELVDIFSNWGLSAVEIGKVTRDGMLRIFHHNKLHAELPAESLVLGGGAPRYKREKSKPSYLKKIRPFVTIEKASSRKDLATIFLELLSSPNLCSRRPLYEQYDSEVGLSRVIGPGGQGGLARIPGTNKGIAVATDCNSRYVFLNPYVGTASAVCESARNVAVCGAKPIGITNCLNFANPHIPENYYIFYHCIRGMKEACKALGIPVTGGNVSFYNESQEGPILPTPTIGMIGILDDIDYLIEPFFLSPNHVIYLLGNFSPTLGASEYLHHVHNRMEGQPPTINLKNEKNLIEFLTEAAQYKLLTSACDLSLGGLALALFRASNHHTPTKNIGFSLEKNIIEEKISCLEIEKTQKLDQFFFGETNGCVVLAAYTEKQILIEKLAQKKNLPIEIIGKTTDNSELDFGLFQVSKESCSSIYEKGLSKIF